MNRRSLLGLGTATAAGALAGCLGDVSVGRSGDTTDGSSTDRNGGDEENTPPPFDADDDDPHERYEVGDLEDDGRHEVYVHNEGDEERTLSLEIVHDGQTAVDETEDVPAGGYLEVITEPSTLEVAIETDGSKSQTTVGGSRACDRSETVVTVRDAGIETSTESTSTDC